MAPCQTSTLSYIKERTNKLQHDFSSPDGGIKVLQKALKQRLSNVYCLPQYVSLKALDVSEIRSTPSFAPLGKITFQNLLHVAGIISFSGSMPYGIPKLEINWNRLPWSLGDALSQGEKMLAVMFWGPFVSDQILWLQLRLMHRPFRAPLSLLLTHPWNTRAGLHDTPQTNILTC